MTKRIMHLTFSLDVGGLETLLLSLLKKIDRSQYRPMVCTLSAGGQLAHEFADNGIEVFSLPKKPGLDPGLIIRLARLFKAQQIDIVHTHNFGAWLYGVTAGALARVPVINTEHSNVPAHKRVQMLAERPMATLSRYIICDSNAVKQHLQHRQKIPASKLKLILNGVDVDAFGDFPEASTLKTSLNIPPEAVVLSSIARLAPVKNHLGLLEAVRHLRKLTTTPFRLLIIGEGECRPALESFVAENDLTDEVIFLGRRRDIPELLAVTDIFVLASLMEGLPIALLEAMASSRPSVVTNVGGNPEILGDDNRAGILVEPRQNEQLAQALAKLIDDPQLRRQLGRMARRRVEEKASLKNMVHSYQNLYKNCLVAQP